MASLSVLIWHRYWQRTTLTNGFWLGVQLFFVISGYCIAAAVDSSLAQGMPFRQFMGRRLRRIGVPYLASVGLALLVAVTCSLDNAHVGRMMSSFSFWIRNLTLTQWSYLTQSWLDTGEGLATPWFNPMLLLGVHWSLNYEEQFYILCGLLLVLPRQARSSAILGGFTIGIAFINVLWPGRITGLFVDYWLQFFCGVLLYVRLCRTTSGRTAKTLDLILIVAVLVTASCACLRGEFPVVNSRFQFYAQLMVCAGYSLLLLGLRRFDQVAAPWLPVRALAFVGKFSYSLYLVHRPLLDAFDTASRSVQHRFGWAVADVCVLSLILIGAYAFYLLFERPFLNPTLQPTLSPTLPIPT